eukprot:6689372-Prymnesium_polylepis.1
MVSSPRPPGQQQESQHRSRVTAAIGFMRAIVRARQTRAAQRLEQLRAVLMAQNVQVTAALAQAMILDRLVRRGPLSRSGNSDEGRALGGLYSREYSRIEKPFDPLIF